MDEHFGSPTTATVNPKEIVDSVQNKIKSKGISILNNTAYLKRSGREVITLNGNFSPGYLINAAGLYADKIALDYGFSQDYKILPFKGLYLYAKDDGLKLKTNVYPVPDLRNPFLGVHFTVTARTKQRLDQQQSLLFGEKIIRGGINLIWKN